MVYASGAMCQSAKPKEFRGVWIATINNLDWPSAPGIPVERQKEELKDLIERIEKFNLNAVFFQVRPASDAFYASSTEPWSYFLSGKQGKSTEPFFDPLAYAIDLCHSKGMELYAWFNPFRVRNLGFYELSKNSFAAKYPQYQHEYDHKRFFDPGFPQVREHIIKVILEVVGKYDIDGVILDDYFYPYPVQGQNFSDSKTFAKYGRSYYPKLLKDWRRNNIDCFISDLREGIKSVKPSMKLGISPFGVWRTKSDDPNGSPLAKGTTSYDDLYADVYKWLSKDWVDFVIPQLYWEQGNRYGDFNAMAKWWNDHSFGKPLYLGQALYKSTGNGNSWTNPKEISNQIAILRKYENVRGFALFSASHLAKLPDIEMRELAEALSIHKRDSIGIKSSVETNVMLTSSLVPVPDLLANKKVYDSIIPLNSGKGKNNFELPGKLKLKRHHKEWQISWSPIIAENSQGKTFVLMAYVPDKESAHLMKVYPLEDKQQIILLESEAGPRKTLFSIASSNAKEPSYSRLFRIRRNRVVYY